MATGKEGVLREVARRELLLLGNPHASYPGCQVHTTFAHPRMRVEKCPRVKEGLGLSLLSGDMAISGSAGYDLVGPSLAYSPDIWRHLSKDA